MDLPSTSLAGLKAMLDRVDPLEGGAPLLTMSSSLSFRAWLNKSLFRHIASLTPGEQIWSVENYRRNFENKF